MPAHIWAGLRARLPAAAAGGGCCRIMHGQRKRVLVTGAAGFIGSNLVDRLLADGYAVTGVDSFEDYYPRSQKEANAAAALLHPAYEFREQNLLTLAATPSASSGRTLLEDLCEQVDFVVHLAAQAGVRASWGESFHIYTENNVRATQLLLEACRNSGVRRFVYASSSSVYGDSEVLPLREDGVCAPISPYGVTKLAGEHLAGLYWKCHGVPTVSLRFFTVYGPRQRPDMAFNIFMRAIIEQRPLVIYGDGGQTRDFTYVSDIVDGLAAALHAPEGSVVNLGGGSRVALSDVLPVLEEVTGMPVDVRIEAKQAGDVLDTWASLDRARSLLGYEPKVALHEGLSAEFTWLRDRLETTTKEEARG